MLELYQADIAKLTNNIQDLSDRLKKIEDKLASDSSPVPPLQFEENIIDELADRYRRSSNLIFYNLDEIITGPPEKNKKMDSIIANDILHDIVPDNPSKSKVLRIGNRSKVTRGV